MASKEKTAALARLLHQECSLLLEFYITQESLPSNSVTGSQLVSVPPLTPQISPSEKICFLDAALRACLHLMDKAITLEDDLYPQRPDNEYTKQRKTVRDRLGYLVSNMERLLVDGKRCETEVKEFVDGGVFTLKKWILQLFQDLVYWSSKTDETLQTLPALMTSRTPRTRRNEARRLRK